MLKGISFFFCPFRLKIKTQILVKSVVSYFKTHAVSYIILTVKYCCPSAVVSYRFLSISIKEGIVVWQNLVKMLF